MTGDCAESTAAVEHWVNDIHQGDAADTLAEMPADSVHMAMCSPPYFGLRDYGVDGQIGLEDSLDEYIDELVNVADELRRVLRDDGSWWLNLGDSFAGSGRGQWSGEHDKQKEAYTPDAGDLPDQEVSLRRKSKMLVPHRVAIALEDAGWIVRSDAVWSKPNPMPHPVKDRLHEHKEFVFHLTPEPDYWFDLDAIREPHKTDDPRVTGGDRWESDTDKEKGGQQQSFADVHPRGKNPGDILEVTTKPFPDAHFAVYPPELVKKPIKSSCPPKVCAECGTGYELVDVEEVPAPDANPTRRNAKRAKELAEKHGLTQEHKQAIRKVGIHDADYGDAQSMDTTTPEGLAAEAKEALGPYFREYTVTVSAETEWEQACDCDTDVTKPGIVLDPFAGAGTTLLKAKELGRRFIGTELNPEYVAMAQKRVGVTVDEPERLLDDNETSLTAYADGGGASD